MKAKKAIASILMAFVLVSIGFALGQETARIRLRNPDSHAGPAASAGRDTVVVYYMRTSFRCIDCNAVEAVAEALLRDEFAEALDQGRLEWRSVDFLEDEALARRYDVGRNMIVVARFNEGREVARRRLDEALGLARQPEALRDLVRSAVQALLEGGQ